MRWFEHWPETPLLDQYFLPEAAPASDAVDRPFVQDELIPVAVLRAAEGSHLGGSLPDLGGGGGGGGGGGSGSVPLSW